MDTHPLPLFRLGWRSASASSSTTLLARLRDAWQRPTPSEQERYLAEACDLADLEQRLRHTERFAWPPILGMWR